MIRTIATAPVPQPRREHGERMRTPRGSLPPMCPILGHYGAPAGACQFCAVERDRPRTDRADMLSARRGRKPYRAGP